MCVSRLSLFEARPVVYHARISVSIIIRMGVSRVISLISQWQAATESTTDANSVAKLVNA